LIEVLSGDATIEQATVPDRVGGLDVIYVRDARIMTEDLFDGRMQAFLDRAGSRYDRIVLDLPPLGGLADGRAIAALADATLLVVRWGSTPAQPIEAALNWLQADGANPVGAVF